LWSGRLGSSKAIERRLELKPISMPVRQNPYRIGPWTQKLINVQVDMVLELRVMEQSQR